MSNISTLQFLCIICSQYKSQTNIWNYIWCLSYLFLFLFFTTPPPRDGHCAGSTHPTGMHSCYRVCHSVHRGVSGRHLPPWRPLKRTVRILLDCIFFSSYNHWLWYCLNVKNVWMIHLQKIVAPTIFWLCSVWKVVGARAVPPRT